MRVFSLASRQQHCERECALFQMRGKFVLECQEVDESIAYVRPATAASPRFTILQVGRGRILKGKWQSLAGSPSNPFPDSVPDGPGKSSSERNG